MDREEVEALVEALIEEARQRARRRRRIYMAVTTLVALGGVVVDHGVRPRRPVADWLARRPPPGRALPPWRGARGSPSLGTLAP